MRFFALAFGLLATIAAAQTATSDDNAFVSPTSGAEFKAGQSTTLTWSSLSSGTVSLRLQWGSTTVASDGVAIASAIKNTGTYTWDVPSDIPVEADYFIRITDDADTSLVNYSARFSISGATGSAVTSTSTSASASSTSMSSSSSSSSTSSSTVSSTSTSTSSTSTSTSTVASSTSTTLVTSSSSSAVPASTSASASTSSSASSSASASASKSASATTIPDSGVGAIQAPAGMMLGVAAAIGAFALV